MPRFDLYLRKNLWILDVVGGMFFGFYLGYLLQLEAESGETDVDRLILAAVVGGLSFLFAFPIAALLKRRIRIIPSWIWLSAVGSVMFAIGNAVVIFPVISWNPRLGLSIPEYLRSLVPYMIDKITFGTAVTTILSFAFLLIVRVTAYVLGSIFNSIVGKPHLD